MRNYPGGGARYPLEVYPIIYEVNGVVAGAYRYEPFHHALVLVDTTPEEREALRRVTREKMGPGTFHGAPSVLLIVTAVFSRTCWKYRGIPYHLILQEVGGLYQTMYLAAAALGLAPCAIGAFPERAAAEILGLDQRDEGQVGMFALGVPRPTDDLDIESLEWRAGSPFSADPGRSSVAIRLRDGRVDVRDLGDVRIESRGDGAWCSVLRGRHRARLNAEHVAQLARWQSGDTG
jgi:SagB-type dehydrogenase family enzyme